MDDGYSHLLQTLALNIKPSSIHGHHGSRQKNWVGFKKIKKRSCCWMQIINPYEIHSAVWIIKRWRWRNEAIAPPPTTFTSPGLEGCTKNMKVIAVADLSHNIMQKKMLKSHDAKFLHKLCLTTTLSGLLTDCVTLGVDRLCVFEVQQTRQTEMWLRFANGNFFIQFVAIRLSFIANKLDDRSYLRKLQLRSWTRPLRGWRRS